MSIPRGATITNEFTVPIDFTNAIALYITYQQLGRTVIEKTLNEITTTSNKLTVTLTQEEGLKLKEKLPVRIQIRGKLADNSVHVSKIIETTVDELLKEGVI